MRNIFKNIRGDKVIWAVVILLSVFSLLSVYSSTGTLAFKYQGGNTEYYVMKHFFILVFGLFLMYAAHMIKYTYYSRISQLAIIVAVPLLLFTLLTGTNINEANRWLTLPIVNLTFQTSDFAKLALVMYVARLLALKQEKIKELKGAFLPIIGVIALICGLIFPANFSTSAILFATSVILMFIGRVDLKYIFALIGMGVVGIALFLILIYNYPQVGRFGTWKNRIENFKSGEGDANYQADQAKIAIAGGELIGKFPGNSTQRNFLPHPYSDFIYAIIIEEYGLIGGIFILLLYLILLYRGMRIASRSPGSFAAFLTIGVCLILVFQAIINMAVAVGIFPVTGQPLPLVSMGGTSIWFTSIAIGIMLSVSAETEKEENDEEKVNKNKETVIESIATN
ncbi:MAG: FtsW/RodA/SpoVE family cell cycle protein [Bacteroidetes bacterium]|nr:FtsW/RodA/SpoVE family cell cycle protein [Bacteroidota bacterium]